MWKGMLDWTGEESASRTLLVASKSADESGWSVACYGLSTGAWAAVRRWALTATIGQSVLYVGRERRVLEVATCFTG